MSHVTSIMLSFSNAENDGDIEFHPAPLIAVQTWLVRNRHLQLSQLNLYFGGEKAPEVNVWAGAFNYLDIEGFIQLVKDQAWIDPMNVQVFVCDQEDERWTLYPIKEQSNER